MAKVKALQTTVGDYGMKVAGEEFEVTEKVAKQLVVNGIVEAPKAELPPSDGNEVTTPEQETQPTKEKASVNITDNTGKEKKSINIGTGGTTTETK